MTSEPTTRELADRLDELGAHQMAAAVRANIAKKRRTRMSLWAILVIILIVVIVFAFASGR